MGKVIRIFLALILALNLYATSKFDKQLRAFDRSFSYSKADVKLKFHHDLKNIYIQSIIKSDKKLKINALKRLIISSKALNLDPSAYEKELASLGQSNFNKIKKPENPYGRKIKPKKNIKQEKKQNEPLKILSVENLTHGIELSLNQNIYLSDVKSFSLKTKRMRRYVFDIKAALIGSQRSYKGTDISQMRVSQYDKNTVRIVLSSPKKLDIKSLIDGRNLYLGLGESQKPKFQQFKANNQVIVIDAGHGGKDAGAVGGKKLYEKNIVLKIALKTGNELKKKGYKVYYTRTKDKFIRLRARTKIANDKKADLFLSIHANAAPNAKKAKSMQGVETFFLSPDRSNRSKNVAALENKSDIEEMNYFSKQTFLNFLNREKIIASNKLAIDIQQSVLGTLKTKYKVTDGGVREAPFWVLVGASMPAILLEVGYITHPDEGARMNTKAYQELISKGIARGIDEYFRKNL